MKILKKKGLLLSLPDYEKCSNISQNKSCFIEEIDV